MLTPPTQIDVDCHFPKPILLKLGSHNSSNDACLNYMNVEECSAWTPVVIPIQLIKFGQLIITAVPSEWTTMMGRRLRRIIKNNFPESNIKIPIAGLSNVYIDYVTTFEEYLKQR